MTKIAYDNWISSEYACFAMQHVIGASFVLEYHYYNKNLR